MSAKPLLVRALPVFQPAAAMKLITARLQEKLVYRFDLVIGLLRTLIVILVFRQLWIVLYGEQATHAGVTIDQTITYAVLSITIMSIFPNSLIMEVNGRIRSGNVLFDLTRPMYYGNLLLFQTLGTALATLLTSAFPLFVVAALLLRITLPTSPLVWLAFLISLGFGFLIAFLIDYLVSLLGFWMTEINGLRFAKWSIMDVFSGRYIPLWMFPFPLKQIALCLPFRGMSYSPIAIVIGKIELRDVPLELGFQLVWLLVLAWLGDVVYHAVVKKLAVQGG